jgi:hypothetical protein
VEYQPSVAPAIDGVAGVPAAIAAIATADSETAAIVAKLR